MRIAREGSGVSVVGWRLWFQWTGMTALGELLGFAVPAAVGGFLGPYVDGLQSIGASLAFGLAMVAAGGVEGAVLGAAQALVLHAYLPRLSRRAWIGRTAAGAVIAWTFGMTPSTLVDAGVPSRIAVATGVGLAPFLLVSIGLLQWTVLRRHVDKAGWWIPANALAWLCGLTFVFGAMAAVDEGTSRAWVIGVAVAAGFAMGATAAALSGLALVWLMTPRLGASRRSEVGSTAKPEAP